jgi:hypothetical protein
VEWGRIRAFVNADFGLSFINESNKIRKSVPPNTSKELKQSSKKLKRRYAMWLNRKAGRLEKYMLDERRWAAKTGITFSS